MNADYRQHRARKRRAIKLYQQQGLDVPAIAKRLKCSKTAVWRYLRETPKIATARRFPNVSKLKRPPFWELHVRNGAAEVVLGRKFCSGCGRWRLLVDFPHDTHKSEGRPCSRCRACSNATRNHYDRHLTEAQLDNRRERHRIYANGKRRAAGVPESTAKRRTVIDHREAIYLPVEPLLVVLGRYNDGEFGALAARAGVPERTIYRFRHGESLKVQIDVADRLAVAMGTTSALVWGEQW